MIKYNVTAQKYLEINAYEYSLVFVSPPKKYLLCELHDFAYEQFILDELYLHQ